MKAPLVKRIAGAIDIPSAGIGFAVIALVIIVLTMGIAPTALAIGLLTLFLID
ncbi:MAG TPA: hypothetical protein VM869_12390 [Enhygromyxa sp.]|nr:hypothetical protein [Enhygromyxa sp.]